MQPRYVVCWYADLGNPGYLKPMRRMCESAKKVMPDCCTVLLTPTEDEELHSFFDKAIVLDIEVNAHNLMAQRAVATTSWQLQSNGLTFYSDPDLIFQKEPEVDPQADIMFSWKGKRGAQPINAGLVIAKPGHLEFWKKFATVSINLPKEMRAWWCDQLAYNMMVGLSHKAGDYTQCFDATVKLVDHRLMCVAAEEGTEESWTLHYKGKRKWNQPRAEKSGDGSLLAASA